MAGERRGSPATVLALIHQLPEGTALTARMSAVATLHEREREAQGITEPEPSEDEEVDDLDSLTHENRIWNTTSRQLAVLSNRVTDLASVFANPGGNKAEKFRKDWESMWRRIGPRSLRTTTSNDQAGATNTPAKKDGGQLMAAMRNMGFR